MGVEHSRTWEKTHEDASTLCFESIEFFSKWCMHAMEVVEVVCAESFFVIGNVSASFATTASLKSSSVKRGETNVRDSISKQKDQMTINEPKHEVVTKQNFSAEGGANEICDCSMLRSVEVNGDQ